jgi:hypothetical protein
MMISTYPHSYGLMTTFCILSVPFETVGALITVVLGSCGDGDGY